MEMMETIFGSGRDLLWYQMCYRALAVFLMALILLRISGRRSFGMKSPLDNVIAVLIGALLSRIIVGVSEFLPVILASLVLVVLHRILGWLTVHSKQLSNLIHGEKICLYQNKTFIKENMTRALVCEEDIMLGVRKSMMSEGMEGIESIYMERNGEISVVKEKAGAI